MVKTGCSSNNRWIEGGFGSEPFGCLHGRLLSAPAWRFHLAGARKREQLSIFGFPNDYLITGRWATAL